MKIRSLLIIALTLGLVVLTGCKTPPEVKQALSSLDQGYAANAKLMAQYKQLADNFNERQIKWNLYVKNRSKLDLALLWATSDPQSPGAPQSDYVQESGRQLGGEVVSLVNRFRLNGLKAQTGDSNDVFRAGTNTMDGLIQAIPALAHAVAKQSATEQVGLKTSSAAFDDYAARVAALRRINQAISTYLNIDVTIKPEDVHDIATSVRTLSGN